MIACALIAALNLKQSNQNKHKHNAKRCALHEKLIVKQELVWLNTKQAFFVPV